ncbi:coiled-coil domain-containing protein 186-like isoform X1 [Biomphalaria glabrata]|uniref:Coiled-coil domain-containing protein 186-like isoform X1 n=1 Tax=Biomphalaria glabrata TaxID=6526 RepID=A0A9W2YAA4_BIOGL|nr:coiled-coil domain-containing protein 186-like isoform X1 [Biomphalaria glabrata]XP_013063064.2 coiled-coil domain-containing protein 186-like isoform X1 [Biomphalaria glabrata]XP_013063067.2 coiled-coil domain-containing protein 186-like isoform X1 [Biomphalaria glabrata]XP_055859632.1 coiled-coil domain-containing protein 186-like isoform X1 [Biomphalaria glabrata]XP_055859641.1 coiled-coil domain-containing protein 186-like isoform X1 [Biomphalaria glabrata]
MSWGEQESIAESLENPDPEEDLDLPRRQNEDVERPEDDLGVPIVETSAFFTENNARTTDNSAVSDQIDNEPNVTSDEKDVHCVNALVAHTEDGAGLASLLLEHDAIPVSNIETDCKHICIANSDKNLVAKSDLNISESRNTSMSEVEQPTRKVDQFGERNTLQFSGDVEVSNNLDDAPEAEIAGICDNRDSHNDEDNMNLHGSHPISSVNSSTDDTSFSCTAIHIQTDAVADQRTIPNDDSIEQLSNEVSDMLAPECDRQGAALATAAVVDDSHVTTESHTDFVPATVDIHEQANFANNDFNNSKVPMGTVDVLASSSCKFTLSTHIPSSDATSEATDLVSNSAKLESSPAENYSLVHNLENALVPPEDHNSPNAICNSIHQDSHSDKVKTINLSNDGNRASNPPTIAFSQDESCFNQITIMNQEVVLQNNTCTSPSKQLSLNSTSSSSQQSSPSRSVFAHTEEYDSNSLQRKLALALQSDDEDELLHELDAELLARPKNRSPMAFTAQKFKNLEHDNTPSLLNGMQGFDMRQLQIHNRQLLEQLKIRDEEISRLTEENRAHKSEIAQLNSTLSQCHCKYSPNLTSADDLYLPQIKELEKTISQQEKEIKFFKEKLTSHDSSAKKTIQSLQNELKSRVDQITKMYEECCKEKDTIVIRFAESEAKLMEAKRMIEKWEAKAKEALKEKESMISAVKTAKADKERLVVSFETKCAEISNLNKEIEKLKEALSSSEFRIKWFQNKLKDELEQHKETKATLEKTTVKLKEAREETEIIRQECQSIVKRYQESEEIKSNSLDKELKIKETELRTQMQEKNDTEEIHQMTKRELDSLKVQHKDILEEVKALKDKVQCLEVERQQNHLMIENYQEIMQRQKTDNGTLKAQVSALSSLEDEYKRAQELIKSLDKDIIELKVANRDLQKDMEACRERESKMLSLQSELSRSNAIIKSENTTLINKSSLLAEEVERMKKEVQELEDNVKKLKEKYEEEKSKRESEVSKMEILISEKTKDCNEFKQKWEDELDNSKTLKRRHANNIKDLTRQLQQVKKKLESMEGKGDAGSMGSRTNSNGSLNSIDNTQHPQPPPQETVITEQVEVDKQVLIERIVRLQKAHARKNEKLEFLGEHIQQLLEEIKKKNKIIQTYILREEAGTLSSEEMDSNKAQVNAIYKMEVQKEIQSLLARKGGIMASVYSVHQQDGTMTLDLSLQINRKLQAVLEDTLLKNITLKENLDTLGEEIARLSQENRRLQLSLQEIQKHSQLVQA